MAQSPDPSLILDFVRLGYLSPAGRMPPVGAGLDAALAGAALIELVRAGRIAVRFGRVEVLVREPIRNPAADHLLFRLAARDRLLPVGRCVQKAVPGIRSRALAHFAATGLLRAEPGRAFAVVPVRRFVDPDAARRRDLVRQVALAWTAPVLVDQHGRDLAALLAASGARPDDVPGLGEIGVPAGAGWPELPVGRATAEVLAAVRENVAAMSVAAWSFAAW